MIAAWGGGVRRAATDPDTSRSVAAGIVTPGARRAACAITAVLLAITLLPPPALSR